MRKLPRNHPKFPETEIHCPATGSAWFPKKVAMSLGPYLPLPSRSYSSFLVRLMAPHGLSFARLLFYRASVWGFGLDSASFESFRPIENGSLSAQRHARHRRLCSQSLPDVRRVYFHPATRAMEVLYSLPQTRQGTLSWRQGDFFCTHFSFATLFWKESLSDYPALDDGVMNTCFQLWITSPDKILADLSQRFVNPQGL